MKFFITSETDKAVGEKIGKAIVEIQKAVNLAIADKQYGEGITYWGYICIAMTSDTYNAGFFKERTFYSQKNKETDFRLKIDYDEVLKASEEKTLKLICGSILRSIDIAESKKIKDFDFNSFRNDLTH